MNKILIKNIFLGLILSGIILSSGCGRKAADTEMPDANETIEDTYEETEISETYPLEEAVSKETELQDSTEEEENPETAMQDEQLPIVERLNGYWGYRNPEGGWEIMNFENGKLNDFTYGGHMWIGDGNVSASENEDGSVTLVISYTEIAYGDEIPSDEVITVQHRIQSDNGFKDSFTLCGDTASLDYTYLGRTREEMDNYVNN